MKDHLNSLQRLVSPSLQVDGSRRTRQTLIELKRRTVGCSFGDRPLRRLLLALLTSAAIPAHAGWTCSGNVSGLTLDPSGNVYMSLANNGAFVWQYKPLCNLRTDWNGVTVSACKSIYALLMTSVALNKTVTFWFDYPNSTSADCSPAKFQSWIPLATDGPYPWYFGPKLD